MSRMAIAISTACARLSITHGPPISASGAPPPISTPATSIARVLARDSTSAHHLVRRLAPLPDARALVLVARFDEARKEWMRTERLRLELGVELHRHKPRVTGNLDHLDELAVE